MQKENNRMMHKLKLKLSETKKTVALLSTVLLLTIGICGTVAYLAASSDTVINQFPPSNVDCTVTEAFDGAVKKNVNVTNTGDIDAYVRVNLISYRVNEQDVRIGGKAEIPAFTLGEGWFQHTDGFYYYAFPVKPGESPAASLIGENGITLLSYTDVDGGRQVVEVMAEAIQADGERLDGADKGKSPVELAWGVTVKDGKLTQ